MKNQVLVYFAPSSVEHQRRERKKAQELKRSAWWKNQKAKGICYHCKQRFAPQELTMDHLIPIARGGVSNKNNCVPACKACNTERKYYLPEELALRKLYSSVQMSEQMMEEAAVDEML